VIHMNPHETNGISDEQSQAIEEFAFLLWRLELSSLANALNREQENMERMLWA